MSVQEQNEVERDILKTVELEREIEKSALIEALNDAQEKHVQQMQRILKELHAQQEKKMAIVVDSAIQKALFLAPASGQPAVLPVYNQKVGSFLFGSKTQDFSKETSKDDDVQISPENEGPPVVRNISRRSDSRARTREFETHQKNVEQNVKDVNDSLAAIVAHARGDREKEVVHEGLRQKLKELVTHPTFEYFVGALIVANAVVIAVQTQMAAEDPSGLVPPAFKPIDSFFTIFFSLELALKMAVEQEKFLTGRNRGWNCFDSIVVASAILEEVLKASTNTTAIRVLRIMRLVRVIRVIRTFRFFNDLRAMVQGIFASILSLFWALVLLFLICFVFGIFITQMVTTHRSKEGGDEDLNADLKDNFGSLLQTMYALYKAITGGDDWSAFADPLFQISPMLGVIFLLYIAFAVFAVLNVVTGVFVDNAIKANQSDADVIILEQTEARKKHIEAVKSVFFKADTDESGHLDLDEFKFHIDNPYVQAYFRQLDLDVEGEGAETLFKLLDFDGNGTIDIEEFIFGCGQLKGFAKSFDLARMRHAQADLHNKLVRMMDDNSTRVDSILSKIMVQFRALQQQISANSQYIAQNQQQIQYIDKELHHDQSASASVVPLVPPPSKDVASDLPGAVDVEDHPSSASSDSRVFRPVL